jgi:hypothetical protein
MESLKIVLLCVGAAVTYGVLHDQVTARVCVEYFPIAQGVRQPLSEDDIARGLAGRTSPPVLRGSTRTGHTTFPAYPSTSQQLDQVPELTRPHPADQLLHGPEVF